MRGAGLNIVAAACTAAMLLPGVAVADGLRLERGPLAVHATLAAEAGYFHTDNAGFGAGLARNGDETLDWFEAYAMPSLEMSLRLPDAGSLFARASVIGSLAYGDAIGEVTFGDAEDVDVEHMYFGWRSGQVLERLGTDAVEVSVGSRELLIGDGFLIQDGNLDSGIDGTYQLVARDAFPLAAVASLRTGPLLADAFYLEADDDYGNPHVVGLNVELAAAERAALALLYVRVLDAGTGAATRENLDTWSVRGHAMPLREYALRLGFEYAYQHNDRDGGRVSAHGGYGEIEYGLPDAPGSPWLRYRYVWLGGDDPGTGRSEAFDPLFYGDDYRRGWGTWSQGEIVGSAFLFNSNERVHHVHAHADVAETAALGVMYWHFALEEPASFAGSADVARSSSFAHEIDVYMDWAAADYLSVSPVLSLALPQSGAEQAFGDDEPIVLVQLYLAVEL